MSRLYVADAEGTYQPASDGAVIEAARMVIARKLKRGPRFGSPKDARKLLPTLLGGLDHEVFCIAYLDKRYRLIHFEEMFRGTIDGAQVFPREVIKSVLHHNAGAVVLVHNHPSGCAEVSQADELITKRLKEALDVIDVRLLDHVVIGGTDVVSMAEKGLL